MKVCLLLLSLLGPMTAFGQIGQLVGYIKKQDQSLNFTNLTVLLKQGETIKARTIPRWTGQFAFTGLEEGAYKLVVQQPGHQKASIRGVYIARWLPTQLTLLYPPPCPFVHPAGERPTCVGGHTDAIIPIVYGLPSAEIGQQAQQGTLYLGGCEVSDCDPLYYCKKHKRSF